MLTLLRQMRESGRNLDTSIAHVFWNKLQVFYKTDGYVQTKHS